MANVDRKYFEGIVRQDRLITRDTINAAASTYTQAGLFPNVPVPAQATACALMARGEMTSADDVRVTSQRGGMPGPDGAAVIWRPSAAAATASYGWDPPKLITGTEIPVAWDTDDKLHPHAVTLSNGDVLCAYHYVGVTSSVRVAKRTATTGAWGSPVAVTGFGVTPTDSSHPCLCLADDGTVYCAYFIETTDGDDYLQVEIRASRDSGATWVLVATSVLPQGLSLAATYFDTTYSRIRLVQGNGQWLLLISIRYANATQLHQTITLQYAATQLASFTLVKQPVGLDTSDLTRGSAYVDALFWRGYFWIVKMDMSGNTTSMATYPALYKIANAYDDLTYADSKVVVLDASPTYAAVTKDGANTAYYLSDGDLSLTVLKEAIYVYSRKAVAASNGEGRMVYSVDYGVTWWPGSPKQTDAGRWWYAEDLNNHPADWTTVAQGGSILMIANLQGAAAVEDDLIALRIGGWSQVSMPLQLGEATAQYLMPPSSWEATWAPFDTPPNYTLWAAGSTGTASVESISTSGYMTLTTTAGNQRGYQVAPTASGAAADRGVLFMLDVAYVEGTVAATGNEIAAYCSLSDGANRWWVAIIVGSGSIWVRDLVAATTLATITTTTTTRTQVLVAMHGVDGGASGHVGVWWRKPTGADAVRAWTQALDNEEIQYDASASFIIRFGHIANATDQTTSRWWGFYYSQSATYGNALALANGFTSPDDLFGAPLCTDGTNLGNDLVVSAVTGPALASNYWTVPREWEYALANILPTVEPSRQIGWRSTADNTQYDIVWDRQLASDAPSMGDAQAILLWGLNFRTMQIAVYIGGTPTALDTIDAAAGFETLAYQIDGDCVRPTVGQSTSTRWLMRNEAAGGTFVDDGGALRRVVGNDPGFWCDPTTKPYARLYLDPDSIDGTEDTNGSAGCLWLPRAFWFRLRNSSPSTVEQLRLRITAQQTVDNDYRIGLCMVGDFIPFGRHPSWGTSRLKSPNMVVTEFEDGRRSVVTKGDARRTVRLTWSESIDQYEIYDADFNPEWYGASSAAANGDPWVAPADTPYNLWGMIDEFYGAATVIAYVRAVEQRTATAGSAEFVTYNDIERAWPMRLLSPVELTETTNRGDVPVMTVGTVEGSEEL